MEKIPHFIIKLCPIDDTDLLVPVKIDGKDKIKFFCTFCKHEVSFREWMKLTGKTYNLIEESE